MDHEQMEIEKNKSALEERSQGTESQDYHKSGTKARNQNDAFSNRRSRASVKPNQSTKTTNGSGLATTVKDEILDYDEVY